MSDTQGLPSSWRPRAEPELTPYEPMRRLGIASALVLAPHPDDEVFGCGGALALAVREGVRVQVVVVSDGAAGGDAAAREQECRAAAHEIGYGADPQALQFWRLPDRGVRPDGALVARLVRHIADGRFEWVLAPSPFEIHPDHRAVCLAAIAACREAGVRLAFYEVGQPLIPNCLVDITATLPAKQRAMRCFASQLAVQDYGEHVSALNRYRSYTLGPAVTHAEALWLLAPEDLAEGLAGVLRAAGRALAARFEPQPVDMERP